MSAATTTTARARMRRSWVQRHRRGGVAPGDGGVESFGAALRGLRFDRRHERRAVRIVGSECEAVACCGAVAVALLLWRWRSGAVVVTLSSCCDDVATIVILAAVLVVVAPAYSSPGPRITCRLTVADANSGGSSHTASRLLTAYARVSVTYARRPDTPCEGRHI